MDSSHILLGWTRLRFKTLNLDKRSPYLRHEGHRMKFKFMTPRQVSKDPYWLKDEIEKEAIETTEGRENEENEKQVEKKMMEILLVNVFSSTVL